jgi:hypothetical protein
VVERIVPGFGAFVSGTVQAGDVLKTIERAQVLI